MYILHFRVTSPANASDLPVAQSVPILKLDVGVMLFLSHPMSPITTGWRLPYGVLTPREWNDGQSSGKKNALTATPDMTQ